MNNDYKDSEKQLVKELYLKMDQLSEEEKNEAMEQIKSIREKKDGKALFADDVSDQKKLAEVLGLKFPESK